MARQDWTSMLIPGHHAYLIAGGDTDFSVLLRHLENKWRVTVKGNADLIIEKFATLYAEDCHEIERKALNKAVEGKLKYYIITFGFMTREAANALLKLFEEPQGTIFFVITPNPERMPPTLLSRFSIVTSTRSAGEGAIKEASNFLVMSLGERFEYSKKFAADITSEKKSRQDALAFVEAVEEILHESRKPEVSTLALYRTLEQCRSYIKDQSSSVKILLDEIGIALANAG